MNLELYVPSMNKIFLWFQWFAFFLNYKFFLMIISIVLFSISSEVCLGK